MNNKNSNFLSKLTLIMPTYNRQSYVLRNINYWNKTGIKLIILDASQNPINKKLLESFEIDITYIHKSNSSFDDRILESFVHIKTKYAQLIGDEDFYISSAITSCINELEKRKLIDALVVV